MQTFSAPRSSSTVVMLVGNAKICPPGCARASKPDDVRQGVFFVMYKPVREVGPWAAEASERPWCVAVKREAQVLKRGAYESVYEAVKRARGLNERMAS